jgi:dihydroflavonol-4-reductase
MTGAKKLVIAASGFLGSDVTQQLFDRGDDIARASRRCAIRCATAATSSTVSSTQGRGCDPAPLFRTNVEGLRHVLDAAVDADLRRFAFISTIGIPAERRPATSN